MNPSAFNPYLNWLSRAHSTNAHNHHFNTCNHHYHNHSSLHTNFCFYFFWKIELKFKRSARKNYQANNQRLFDYITDYSANQMNNQDIGIKKVSRHTLRAGKSAVYAVSRLLVYYSNSSADDLIWLFFYEFYWFYYSHFSKLLFLFATIQIFRAKIEPTWNTNYDSSVFLNR